MYVPHLPFNLIVFFLSLTLEWVIWFSKTIRKKSQISSTPSKCSMYFPGCRRQTHRVWHGWALSEKTHQGFVYSSLSFLTFRETYWHESSKINQSLPVYLSVCPSLGIHILSNINSLLPDWSAFSKHQNSKYLEVTPPPMTRLVPGPTVLR